MPAPFHDLLSKCEEACKSLIDGLSISGYTVNTGLNDDEHELDCINCYASGSAEEVVDTGLDRVRMEITVKSNADSHDLAAHRSIVAQVTDLFRDADARTDLTAAVSDFGVVWTHFIDQSAGYDGNIMMNTINLDIICCPKDLT